MKKGVNKVLILACLSLMLIFLVSCGGRIQAGEEPRDTAAVLQAVQTGTQGVELEILQNAPPPLIYDQNELIALVEVHNRGNDDLTIQDCFVQITGFDPNIIKGWPINGLSCAANLGGDLEGKNVYNTQGGINQLEFKSSNIGLPAGVFEYNPTLNFVTCYKYQTIANPSVCVDPLFYQVTHEQKSCTPQNVAMGGGQGAPVGVSYVGVDMVGNRAIFEINVMNFGTGQVLSPNADIRNCGHSSLDYDDLDKVRYTAQLSGGSSSMDCKPRDSFVRLNNGQGKIVCSATIPGTSAYETPLMIDFDYGYVQSVQKPIKIVKTPE
jgi:hypothetical protein